MEPCQIKSGMDAIMALPTSLQIDLFTKWCKLKDIALLDSALCREDQRSALVSTWREPHCIFGHYETRVLDVSENLANWIAHRELKLSCKVSVPEDLSNEVLWHRFFTSTRTTLRAIKYPSDFGVQSMNLDEAVSSMNYFVDMVATCTSLTELTFSPFNPDKVDICPILVSCSKLKNLNLLSAHGLDLKSIHALGHSIEALDISFYRPQSDQASLSAMEPTNMLRKFRCFFSSIVDFQPLITFLWSSTGLRELYIDGVCWSDITGLIGRCPELTTVRVNDTYADYESNMDEEVDYVIARGKNLRYLQLVPRTSGILFSEREVLKLLRGCLQLVALVLHEFNTIHWVLDKSPLPLPREPSSPCSSCLQVFHATTISTANLREVLVLCPHLVELGIAESEEMQHVIDLVVEYSVRRLLVELPEDFDCGLLLRLKNMESLHLTGCATLTSVQLLQVAKNNPTLTSLVVYGCFSITIDIIDDLASELSALKRLVLSDGESSVRDLSEELRETCPQLKKALVELSK